MSNLQIKKRKVGVLNRIFFYSIFWSNGTNMLVLDKMKFFPFEKKISLFVGQSTAHIGKGHRGLGISRLGQCAIV